VENGRRILVGDVVNARDLGGTPLRPGQHVAFGTLLRGPPLAALTSAGCSAFEQLGIHSVIDLRVASETDTTPEALCVQQGARVVEAPLPVPYNVNAQDYIADLDASPSIAEAFRVLGDDAAYPVYFHCTWGRDRTGVLGAVILLTLGASRDAIMQEYLLSLPSVGAYPMALDGAIDELERRGGVEVYLHAAGVSDEQIAVLRERAIAK
jgi:protein-tyrosine phosphatase